MAPWLLFAAFLGVSTSFGAPPASGRPTIDEVRERFSTCMQQCTSDDCRVMCVKIREVDLEIAD